MSAGSDDEKTEGFLECSLCFENDKLKRLPCNHNHIYCETCLTKDAELTQIIKCPLCRTVFDEGIDDIPSAGAPLDKSICCDVCMRKDDKRRLAQIYCVICQKKFCTPHEKSHNDALDDHRRIRMDEYKRDYRKMETKYCEKHSKEVSHMACQKCHLVFCAECVEEMGWCSDGSPHELTKVTKLVAKLTEMVNEKKVWIFDKEEHLLGMSKQLTAIISDWDTETQQMIENLHQARDEQISELAKKYAQLESQLVEMRIKAKTEVTHYLDNEIGVKLDKLSRQVARIDARIHTYHEVDVLIGFKETKGFIEELIRIQIPTFTPTANHVHISCTDCEEIELAVELVMSKVDLDIPPNLTPALIGSRPPSAMELVLTVKFNQWPESVTKQGDVTYIGLFGGEIITVKEPGSQKFMVAQVGGWVSSIQIYAGEIFVLVYNRNLIKVFDLPGNFLRSWKHISNSADSNKLRVVGGKVIVPSGGQQSLSVYTLQGQLLKQIKCPSIKDGGGKALAVCGDDSVIVADFCNSSVFRVNVETGVVMWTSYHVNRPGGVVCYKNYVLTYNGKEETTIWILDINTGKFIGEMKGEKGMQCHFSDLFVDGDTLIMTKITDCSLQYYKMIAE